MQVKNLDELKSQIRPFLKKYLSDKGISIGQVKFQCPNHKIHKNSDKTPAASFWPDDSHFNCFVCSAAGDIFNAAFYLENKPLKGNEFVIDNVLYLAKYFNIKYEIIEETEEEKYQKQIYKVLELTAKFCHVYLEKKQDKRAMKYIEDRGWNKIKKQFYLGYSPTSRLYSFLKSREITDKMIVDAGLTIFKDGKLSLPFPIIENRLIIPWKNYFGKISAFVSRTLDENIQLKYLHSHNTIVHQKSKDLFNLNEAKKYSDDLYIVESNASVLTLSANDILNCIALSGKDLTEEQYDLLVRLNIKKIIICLDNDDAGLKAIEKIINNFKDKKDLLLCVKELPREDIENKKLKDPDDFIKRFGVDKFNNLPELSAFDWILNKFSENIENEFYKEIIISLILIESNFFKKEKLIKRLSDKTNLTQKTILQEIEKYSSQNELITSVKEVIEAKESLINNIDEFEEKVWKRSNKLLGIDTGWNLFNKIFDGLQEGFYIIGGRTNIGKSAIMLSLTYNLLKVNLNNIYILYFNIDDSNYKCIGRLISIDSKISINWIKNPKYKIKLNDTLLDNEKEKLLIQRDISINFIKSLTQSLAFKSVNNIEEIVKITKIYNKIANNERKRLIVFIDKVHNINSFKKLNKRELTDYVSVELKSLVNNYDIPMIGSLEVTKASIMSRPTESDIKETQKLEDDSDAAMLLYNEYKIDNSTQYVFFDNKNVYPIIEMIVPKNKLNDLSGYDTKIFFKFYPHLSYVEECNDEEQIKYSLCKNG